MIKKFNIRYAQLSIGFTVLVMVLVSNNLNWRKNSWEGIIESDAKGYYAYLPAIFIYNDLNFGFFEELEGQKYFNENYYFDYRMTAHGTVVNKCYAGTALAELPFFLIAHGYAKVSKYEADGYAKPYSILISVGALFYLLLGLIFLNKTLQTYEIKDWIRAFVILAAVFGTNLFYYTVGEPGMSHIYSFAFAALFIFLTRKYLITTSIKYFIYAVLVLGIITLIRPINGIIIFLIPFLSGEWENLKGGFRGLLQQKIYILLAVAIFLVIVSIQLLIYKISTGHFFVYSYGEEGFNFLNPRFIDILFSYKKGLFLYTPLFLLSLCGLYAFYKRSKFQFFFWVLFFLLITYVFSSWWNWYYGGSFSSRVYVEYIPIFMIPLGYGLQHLSSKFVRGFAVSLICILIIVCQIQTYQYRYFQIHWSEMTKEKYWNVFLRLDKL